MDVEIFRTEQILIAHNLDVRNEAHHSDMSGFKDERYTQCTLHSTQTYRMYVVHIVYMINARLLKCGGKQM